MKKNFTLVLLCFITSKNVLALPKLSSLSTAKATIFLDFDGHNVNTSIWNGGKPLHCAPSGMNDAQILEIFNRVAEDYRPFDLDITTDSTVFLAAPLAKRIRMIVTTTSSWYAGVGGVAYIGSFTWGDDTPGFIFSDKLGPFNAKMVAECCSHESGHTVGLSHQSKYDGACSLTAIYNNGTGSGETGWAPIMGNGYYKNRTGWNNGPTPNGCSSLQDNLSIITANNGFTYRVDDHSNDLNTNPTPLIIGDKSFSGNGIITTASDKDAFEINLPQNGVLHLSAIPFSVGADDNGADLDIKLTLLNALMQTINTYNPAALLSVLVDTPLLAGKYYIVIDGTGSSFSSDYGSLGSYTITGTFLPLGVTPIREITLDGKVENNKHDLSWNIISDEPIKSLDLQSSTDGSDFKSLAGVTAIAKNFVSDPFVSANIFYRLRAVSVLNQTAYSNVIVLYCNGRRDKSFAISNVVRDEIIVTAAEDYQYLVADIGGNVISRGNNNRGINRININSYPRGMYVMQIISKNERVTERIIRQ